MNYKTSLMSGDENVADLITYMKSLLKTSVQTGASIEIDSQDGYTIKINIEKRNDYRGNHE